MIPLYEPKTKHPIAFFKVYDVPRDNTEQHNRLCDLVHLTLQSHINLLDELHAADSLLQYLQVELNPRKVVRLRTAKPVETDILLKHTHSTDFLSQEDSEETISEFLLICKNQNILDHLALELHNTVNNHFFIRCDHMANTFMNSIDDLLNFTHTTVYIPNIEALSVEQQKTLSNYLIGGRAHENHVMIICGSMQTITQLSARGVVSLELLKHLNVFNILRDIEEDTNSENNLASIRQCAQAVLGAKSQSNAAIEIRTKSYHLIPSLNDIFPTFH
jgi:hypothetical protein